MARPPFRARPLRHAPLRHGRGQQPDQGYRSVRRRTRQPAGWIWLGCRPERHRRRPGQCRFHPRKPDWHAAAPGCQCARRRFGYRQRRRGHDHRQSTALFAPRLADRHRCLGPGGCRKSARRHPFGNAAAGGRRRSLCRGPGSGPDWRLLGRGRSSLHHPGGADRGPHSQRCDHRTRTQFRVGSDEHRYAGATEPRLPRRAASPPRSTDFPAPKAPHRSTPPRSCFPCLSVTRATLSRC